MTWNVVVADPSRKSLRRFPEHDAQAIQRAFRGMEQNPFSGDVRKMGPGTYRRRDRDYRIFFDLRVDQRVVEVTAIMRGTTTTYR